jgi:hypothetical protein
MPQTTHVPVRFTPDNDRIYHSTPDAGRGHQDQGIAAVYAPGLSPMDFHAVVETAVGGVWTVVDATKSAPRPSLLRISTGPDAASTPFATVQAGRAELTAMVVRVVADAGLPGDDHIQPCHLA